MSNEIHGSSIVEASQPSAEIELPYKYAICVEFSSTSPSVRCFPLQNIFTCSF